MLFTCFAMIALFISTGWQDLSAQNTGRTVSGVVVDESGVPVVGAAVLEKGTDNGTLADLDGNFSIELQGDPQSAVLVFSSIGFDDAEMPANTRNKLRVILKSASLEIEGVVVVGYGTQKKESVVGAIASAKGEALTKAGGVSNVSRSLAGLVPGLVTINTSGKPGADEAEILIRGKSTWNDSEPLVLVDNVERDMNDIDPEEIESISILKDASATAVFGVRGANGVILITTKRGTTGKPQVRFGFSNSVKVLSNLPTVLESFEDNWLRNEALELAVSRYEDAWAKITPTSHMMHYLTGDSPYLFPNVNWRDEIVKPGWSQKYNVDVSGGNDFVKYFASLSYLYDDDILAAKDLDLGYDPSNNYKRFNFRANLDFQLTRTTQFSIDLSGYRGEQNSSNIGAGGFPWEDIYAKSPCAYPVYYEDGVLGYDEANEAPFGQNPVATLNYSGVRTNNRTDLVTTMQLKQSLDFITKGLTLKGQFTYQTKYETSSKIESKDKLQKYIDPSTGIVRWVYPDSYKTQTHHFDYYPFPPSVEAESAPQNLYRNTAYQVSLDYNRSFGEHNVTALALWKRNEYAYGSVFPTYREEWAGRITYDYAGRYLFETNMAYNGSEAFGPGYKFGFFPSVAVGWVITNEKFMEKVKFVNFLKIRYSIGTVGSDSGIPRWLYVDSWLARSNTSYGWSQDYLTFGEMKHHDSPYHTYSEGPLANPEAHWETAVKNNIGLESKFFDNTLTFNIDYFWNRRKGIFLSADQRNVSPWLMADAPAANIGETKDHGIDLELRYTNYIGREFRYYLNFGLGIAKNEIIYKEDPKLLPDYQKQAGFPIGVMRSVVNGGVITNWNEAYLYPGGTGDMSGRIPGDYYQVDYNADGYIDNDDSVPFGFGSSPEQMYTFILGFEWKGLSVSANIYGIRNYTMNYSWQMWSTTGLKGVNDNIMKTAWLPGRTEFSTNRPVYMNVGPSGEGNEPLMDGTLWRIKTAEIAYTFRGKALKFLGISSLRLYLNGNNLFLWSHLDIDREQQYTYDKADRGGFAGYPMTRTITAGFNLTF